MNEFLTGQQITPDHIVTAHQEAEYLLREVHALTGRLRSLQSYTNGLRDEVEARDNRDGLRRGVLVGREALMLELLKRLWCDVMHSHRDLIKVGPGVWSCSRCWITRVHPAFVVLSREGK